MRKSIRQQDAELADSGHEQLLEAIRLFAKKHPRNFAEDYEGHYRCENETITSSCVTTLQSMGLVEPFDRDAFKLTPLGHQVAWYVTKVSQS